MYIISNTGAAGFIQMGKGICAVNRSVREIKVQEQEVRFSRFKLGKVRLFTKEWCLHGLNTQLCAQKAMIVVVL